MADDTSSGDKGESERVDAKAEMEDSGRDESKESGAINEGDMSARKVYG
jgi:hypothetical protein